MFEEFIREKNIQEVLKEKFKLDSFRTGQEEIINSVLDGNDTMVLMPTGGGKSLCYQLPAMLLPGLTLVISPLIALMKDQVDSLQTNGLPAEAIHSGQNFEEQKIIYQKLQSGEIKILFVAPERLKNNYFRSILSKTEISLAAVDEAHCISEWGHDFRPDYVKIPSTLVFLNNPPVLALTATATPEVRKDISKHLKMKNPKIFMSGFDRPNLYYSVENCRYDTEKDRYIKAFLSRFKGPGIIYASTRKKVEHIHNFLTRSGHACGKYHAGMEDDDRIEIQDLFMAEKIDVIVATNAFGMGIDKKNIRFVIHYNFPRTIEALSQESGRAGRDGKDANAIMLFSAKDRYIQEFFIDIANPPTSIIKRIYEKILKLGRGKLELTYQDISRLMADKTINDTKISSSVKILEDQGFVRRLDRHEKEATIFLPPNKNILLEAITPKSITKSEIAMFFYRSKSRLIRSTIQDLADEIGIQKEKLQRELNSFSSKKLIQYEPPFKGRGIFIPEEALPFSEFDSSICEEKRKREIDKLEVVLKYAYTRNCRRKFILDYFEDDPIDSCGNCDKCTGGMKLTKKLSAKEKEFAKEIQSIKDDRDSTDPEHVIIRLVAETRQRYGKGMLIDILAGSKKKDIIKRRLNMVESYGLLKHLKKSEIEHEINSLIRNKLLKISGPRRYPVIKLNS